MESGAVGIDLSTAARFYLAKWMRWANRAVGSAFSEIAGG